MKWAKPEDDKEIHEIPADEKKRCYWLFNQVDPVPLPTPSEIEESQKEDGDRELEPENITKGVPAGKEPNKVDLKIRRKKNGGKGNPNYVFKQWVLYGFRYEHNDQGKYEVFKKRYEMFCGGWLEYYDCEVRKKQTDHCIYFEWAIWPVGGNGNLWVRIWISPPPKPRTPDVYVYIAPPNGRTRTDPPPPPPPPPPPLG
jgi:hypothetical protein